MTGCPDCKAEPGECRCKVCADCEVGEHAHCDGVNWREVATGVLIPEICDCDCGGGNKAA